MISAKGLGLLGVGFWLGYSTALAQNEQIHSAVIAFKNFLQDEANKDDVERRKKADAEAEAEGRPNTSAGATEPPDVKEAEVIDDDETHDEVPQGETPS